jgi:hypothetical protein
MQQYCIYVKKRQQHRSMTTSVISTLSKEGSVAEWSKALVLGTSPQGRGFESHRCQDIFFSTRKTTRLLIIPQKNYRGLY